MALATTKSVANAFLQIASGGVARDCSDCKLFLRKLVKLLFRCRMLSRA